MKGSTASSAEPSLQQILFALYTLPSDPAHCITLADALADSSTWLNSGFLSQQKLTIGSNLTIGKPGRFTGKEGR